MISCWRIGKRYWPKPIEWKCSNFQKKISLIGFENLTWQKISLQNENVRVLALKPLRFRFTLYNKVDTQLIQNISNSLR